VVRVAVGVPSSILVIVLVSVFIVLVVRISSRKAKFRRNRKVGLMASTTHTRPAYSKTRTLSRHSRGYSSRSGHSYKKSATSKSWR